MTFPWTSGPSVCEFECVDLDESETVGVAVAVVVVAVVPAPGTTSAADNLAGVAVGVAEFATADIVAFDNR